MLNEPLIYSELSRLLVDWFHRNKRTMPWRGIKDPYYIWISEVMLQQTQVETVIPYFERFIDKFPKIEDLANSEEEIILKLWEGLGYYSRAKRMRECAKIIVDQFNGVFPREYHSLMKLPGIGPYTAGAILSIAFDKKCPAVDGNVFRVVSRIFNIGEDISKTATRKYFEDRVFKIIEKTNEPGNFNQGLMELGATICTPKKPLCSQCPIQVLCKAYELKNQNYFPVNSKKVYKPKIEMEVAWVTYKDKVMITKRPSEGLLGDLWGLPIVESNEGYELGESILEEVRLVFGQECNIYKDLKKSASHVFTHKIWKMRLFHIELEQVRKIDYPEVRFVKPADLQNYPIPTAFNKLL